MSSSHAAAEALPLGPISFLSADGQANSRFHTSGYRFRFEPGRPLISLTLIYAIEAASRRTPNTAGFTSRYRTEVNDFDILITRFA